MSENDRMERAKRIRRMREGQREEGDEPSEESDDEQTAESDSEAEESTTDDSTPAAETATTDGGAATTAEAETTDETDSDTAETNTEAVAETVGEMETATESETDENGASGVDSSGGTRAELPDAEEMEAALEETIEQAETVDDEAETVDDEADFEATEQSPAGPAGIAEEAESTQEAETRVLEFTLDDEQYCLDIEYIEEIVKHTNITRVPNTAKFVEGVVDLRGQITTILNPKVTIDKPNTDAGDIVVVFDGDAFEDQGYIGWVVDDVRQVSPVSDEEVNDPPMAEDYINGVIDREDDDHFVIWTTPDLALEEAE